MALSATTSGTSVSHTPCARFTPPIASHATLIARISDCTRRGANSLNPSLEATSTCPITTPPRNPKPGANHISPAGKGVKRRTSDLSLIRRLKLKDGHVISGIAQGAPALKSKGHLSATDDDAINATVRIEQLPAALSAV